MRRFSASPTARWVPRDATRRAPSPPGGDGLGTPRPARAPWRPRLAPQRAHPFLQDNEDPQEEEEDEDEEDEEEVVDPRLELREKCEGSCTSYKKQLEECEARVNSRPGTEETCTQELFDFLHCVDHCVGCGRREG